MNKRLLLQAFAGLSLSLIAPFSIAASADESLASAPKHHKVVIQVSDADPAKWTLALNNAANLQGTRPENVDIEIVAYGPGVAMFRQESPMGSRIHAWLPEFMRSSVKLDSPFAPRVAKMGESHVKLLVCENSMRGQKLSRDDMLPGIGYVPSGVVEIMTRQSEGWAYLRP